MTPDANRPDIHALNGLIQSLIDSAAGYREAAAETDHAGYRELFEARDLERRQIAADLGSTVRGLGGEPSTEGSILAKAQRAFTDIKHALLRDEVTVVGAVEASEDALKSKFEKAIADTQISATTRDTVRRAYERIRAGHDQMRDLKHSLEGQRDAGSRLFPQ